MVTMVTDRKVKDPTVRAGEGRQQEPTPVVKLSFNVAPHQLETLKQLAREQGVTMTEVLRHAIALEAFLRNQIAPDERIIVESKKDNSRRELVLLGP